MGRLVVIEGLDGAGKRTLTDRLLAALLAGGARSATLAFPRYAADVHAELLARRPATGGSATSPDSVHGMAVLFALDRRAAAARAAGATAENDAVLVDRYVASTPRTAPPGCTRTRRGSSWPGCGSWRSTGSGCPCPPAPAAAVPQGRRGASGRRTGSAPSRAGSATATSPTPGCRSARRRSTPGSPRPGWLAPWTTLDGRADIDVGALAGQLLR